MDTVAGVTQVALNREIVRKRKLGKFAECGRQPAIDANRVAKHVSSPSFIEIPCQDERRSESRLTYLGAAGFTGS